MKKKILLLLFLTTAFFSHAQNTAINSTGALPNASAMLDITSNNKGLLIPRVALTATTDNTTIVSPAISLLIYNTATAGSGNTAVTPGFHYWNGSGWVRLITDGAAGNSAWQMGGNGNTNPSINFIGTTDAQPLIFKINNIRAGIIDSIPYNTGIGFRTFDAAPTGTFNTAMGYKSLMSNTTGGSNTGIGSNALRVNTSGYSNTAVGNLALFYNTDRSHLVAVGDSALHRNGLGATQYFEAMDNTAVGSKSLFSNTTGYSNTAVGTNALYNNTNAPLNSALGYYALSSNSTGSLNTAIGSNSLLFNSTGSANTAVGSNSLYLNNGTYNTAVGTYTMEYNSTGSQNTSVGTYSLNKNTSGGGNTSLGTSSLQNNTTGYENTASGLLALYSNTTGFTNSALGSRALSLNTTGSGNTATGAYALQFDTSGSSNTASGFYALNKNTNGGLNTATGASSLISNTTGQANTGTGAQSLYYNTTGGSNSGQGFNSLYKNINGSYNTATGVASLNENTGGNYNSASGSSSLYSNSSGNYNSAVGASSLFSNTTGTNNTGLGYHTDVFTGNLSNATAIGANSRVDCSNCMVLGSVIGINGAGGGVNVGIGITTPQATLEVRGNTRTGGTNNFISYDSASGRIVWTNSHLWVTAPQYLMKHSASSEGLYSNGSQLEYRNSTGNPVFFTNWNNGNGYFSGRLGIGTVNPSNKLHIWDGTSGITPFFSARMVIETNNHTYINLLSPDPFETGILFGSGTNAVSGLISYNSTTVPKGFIFNNNGNQTRMVIDNAGKVGIGVNSPGAKLHVIDNGGSGGTPFAFSRLAVEGDGHTYINMISPDAFETAILFGKASNATSGVIMYNNSTTPDGFQFRNNGNLTRMVIDNAGNVGMGTTAPGAKLEITHNGASTYGTALLINQNVIGNSDGPKIQFQKTMTSTKSWSAGILNGVNVATFSINEDGGAGGFGTTRFSIAPGGNTGIGTSNPLTKLHIQNGNSGNSSPNSPVTVESSTNTYINLLSPNTNETGILFGRADNAVSGGIIYNNQGPGGTNNGFQIRVNGNQEAARIDNNGNMAVGTGSIGDRFTIGQKITNPYALTIYEINAAGNGASYWRMGIDPGTKRLYFLSNTAGTNIAYIDPTNGNWVAISDKSLKQDIVPLGHVMAKVMQLNPVSYKMLHQYNDERSYGFLAQELQQVIPDAVKQFGNSGDPKSGISYTHLIPVTIAAIQEQQQTIETLQQQVNELKKMVEQLLRK